MTEQTLRRLLENKGYEPDEVEDAIARWADEQVDEEKDNALQ